MPLQIRRGTELQRLTMTVPLASGELLYVTDDQRLYIGNGTTLGGVPITGYNDENAVDAVGAALVAGVHSGITFTYGPTQDASGRIDASIDLSDYSGTLKADSIRGTIVADDSTILVDAVSGRIVGPVFSNVVGNLTGNVTGDVSGNVTGNVTGNITGIVTGTVGSTLTGDVTGNLTGYHFGDTSGSVFADDSTLLVDAVDGVLRGTHIGLVVSTNVTTELLTVNKETGGLAIPMTGIGDDTNVTVGMEFRTSRGTLQSPTNQNDDDFIFVVSGRSWKSAINDYALSVGILGTVDDSNPDPSGNFIGGKLSFYTSDGTRSTFDDTFAMSFDSRGVLTAPVIKAASYTTVNLPSSPDAGFIVFDSTSNQFKGWNGSSWVVLG